MSDDLYIVIDQETGRVVNGDRNEATALNVAIGYGSKAAVVKYVDALKLDSFREDALRYRWLKEHHLQVGPDCWIRTGDDLDDATQEALND